MNLERLWYDGSYPVTERLLAPLSSLFKLLSQRRAKRLKATAVAYDVPVIVVGNITVGGTGKTPMIQWLAVRLTEVGLRVVIVSRGYGGKASYYPYVVDPLGDVTVSGDEALLLAQTTQCPVVIDPNRHHAVLHAIYRVQPDVVLSDDGMQHYAMHRDLEIVMVDGGRGFGNGHLLPAGPLREGLERLASVDYVFAKHSGHGSVHESVRQQAFTAVLPLAPSQLRQVVGSQVLLAGQQVHVVAGIGNPQAFFDVIADLGYQTTCHAFRDHYQFGRDDFDAFLTWPIIMTEKDWVKCQPFSTVFNSVWVLPMAYDIPEDIQMLLVTHIQQLVTGSAASCLSTS